MSKKQKTQVLSDHKKVGNRFVPPWLQHFTLDEVSYVNHTIPELVWLAMLNERLGLRHGPELALDISKIAIKVYSESDASRKPLFGLASSYSDLTELQKSRIIEYLADKGKLTLICDALAPIAVLYPEFPLKFLYLENAPSLDDYDFSLNQFKTLLDGIYDKYNKPATMMQATAIYIAFVTDILKVAPHVALANFPAISEYPATEESERVAAGVRAIINGFVGKHRQEAKPTWGDYFWNRGLEIESCGGKRLKANG